MRPEYQDIMISFIEETEENIQTIESGLLNLQTTVQDFEASSTMLRATHSIKGAAGMLDLSSIQYIAHRMEDYCKVLQTHPIQVDQTLKAQLFQGLEAIKTLTKHLEGNNFTLSESFAQQILQEVEPVFAALSAQLMPASQAPVNQPPSPSRSPKRQSFFGKMVITIQRFFRRLRQTLGRWLGS